MFYAAFDFLKINEVYEFDTAERREVWIAQAEKDEPRIVVDDVDTIVFLTECGEIGRDFDGNRIYYYGLTMPY